MTDEEKKARVEELLAIEDRTLEEDEELVKLQTELTPVVEKEPSV
jgi:hypothetical protein